MEAYGRNRQTVHNAAIDGNPMAEAILQLASLGAWAGNATELLTTLREIAPMLTDDPQTFPRQPNRLTSELKRIQPLLRSRQVELRFGREGASGQRVIRIECPLCQGSCPLLYFSSNCQAGGIGR